MRSFLLVVIVTVGAVSGCSGPGPADVKDLPRTDESAGAVAAFDAAIADESTTPARRGELSAAAAAALRTRIDGGDGDPALAAALSRVTRLGGAPGDALKVAERGLAANPGNTLLLKERIWCLRELLGVEAAMGTHEGRTSRASAQPLRAATKRACIELAAAPGMKTLGDGCAALVGRSWQEAMLKLGEAIGAEESDPELLSMLADACMSTEDPVRAEMLVSRAMKSDATRVQFLAMRSRIRERLGDDAGADADADRALSLWPRHVHGIDAKAGRLIHARDATGMRSFALRVEEFRPRSACAFALRTLALLTEERKGEALVEADECVRAWPGAPVPLLLRTMTKFAALDRDGVRKDSEEALRLAPDEPEFLWLMAKLASVQGKLKEAEKHLAAGLQTDPFDSGCLSLRGELRLEAGRPGDALADLERAARIRPSDAHILMCLAKARGAMKDLAGASDAWAKSIARKPGDAEIRSEHAEWLASRGDKAGAIAELAAAASAAKPDGAFEILQRLADLQESVKDLAGARTTLDEIVAKYPKKSLGWNQRANFRANQGDREGALEDYGKALAIDPGDSVLHYNRAVSLRHLKRSKEALADLDAAVRLPGVNSGMFLERSNLLDEMGNPEAAMKDADRALELDASDLDALVHRARLRHDHEDKEGALSDLDRAIKINPDAGGARNLRGVVRSAIGRHEDALVDLEVAIRVLPTAAMPLRNKGDALVGLRRFDEALEAYSASLRLAPDNPAILNARGIAHFRRRKFEEASTDFRAAAERMPAQGQFWRNLAESERSGGKSAAAHLALDRAIRAEPDNGSWHLDRASWLDADGRVDDALSEANLAVGLMKGRFEPLNFRGVLRQKADDLRGALEDFGRAAEIAPGDGTVLSNLATLRLRTGDSKGAVSASDRAFRAAPGSAPISMIRCQCYAAAGRASEVVKEMDALLRTDPKSASLLSMRAIARFQRGDSERAAEDLARALETDAGDPFVRLARARSRSEEGKPEESIADLSAFLGLYPSAPCALRLRAEAYRAAGRPKEAVEDLHTVVKVFPSDPAVLVERGEAYLESGDAKSARADASAAMELEPGSVAALALRGVARHEQGEVREAITDLEDVLRKAPAGWTRRGYFERLLMVWREEK